MQNQMLFTPRLNGRVNPTFLSEVPGATAAYSLRRLSLTYTGALIRVRRTDNQELDITGTTIGLDESQLLTFVGSGDAFVTTIYDQSGNNNHLTQLATANQPIIVTAGVINKLNGRPAIFFDGVNGWFKRTFTIGTVLTRFAVISHVSPQNDSVIVFDDGNTADRAYLTMSSTTTLRMTSAIGANLYYAGVANNVQFSTYNLFNTTNSEISVDNRPIGTGSVSSSAVTYNGISIGTRGGLTPGYHASFHFQELIMYASNQSANRAIAMNNINQHYQISWDGFKAVLLDLYPGAAAAYSLRNLSASYTGPLVRVRRASDSVELDIYGKYDGTIDTQSLTSFCAGTNGFVRTWYDQSGLSNNVIQTSSIGQPQIVLSGTLITQDNGVHALLYDGSNDILQGTIPQIVSSPGASLFYVYSSAISAAPNTNSAILWGFLNGNDSITGIIRYHASSSGILGAIDETMFLDVRTVTGGSERLISSSYKRIKNILVHESTIFASTGTTFYQNGDNITLSGVGGGLVSTDLRPSTLNWESWFELGAASYGVYANQRISEMIVYNSDQTTNRSAIESNLNSFYNIHWDGSKQGLLDNFPGAAAAYSLRALSSQYTGPLIRVRRASDNQEQDIYARQDGTLDTQFLTTFCSATNGFVTTWYDQSGLSRNATQTTAANQPQIVASGTVLTCNIKPAIKGDGGDSLVATFTRNQPHAAMYVGTIVNGDFGMDAFSGVNDASIYNDASRIRISANTGGSYSELILNANPANYSLISALYNGASSRVDLNTSSATGSIGTNGAGGVTILSSASAILSNAGFVQEVIIWTSNNTSDWTGIQSNINSFYQIY